MWRRRPAWLIPRAVIDQLVRDAGSPTADAAAPRVFAGAFPQVDAALAASNAASTPAEREQAWAGMQAALTAVASVSGPAWECGPDSDDMDDDPGATPAAAPPPPVQRPAAAEPAKPPDEEDVPMVPGLDEEDFDLLELDEDTLLRFKAALARKRTEVAESAAKRAKHQHGS